MVDGRARSSLSGDPDAWFGDYNNPLLPAAEGGGDSRLGARSLRSAFGFLDRPDGGHTDESGMGSGNPPAESTGNTRSGVFI